uniref:Uncharacterized protein n=1 Tax=Phaeomonas parva TaxID=124430 RepID=A0A7S1UMT4_9STRA|mmetsp:Transcript_9630/g.28286  ORF Transcript_9630/g.28286 Transcript_9630/m.28286 type:complete len:127 (+) Transcript_9630:140-520(+)|eukprot:CAMPEP_0118855092 /NCGR_PEP_ID=MMETSP1163-20130328/3053_1 /TAXON_ID=124430 /ORGANISM="Phaeomonas parva, Strain CCMP2877" /LENGTH=126 /DNA_ID=CAMNT_0006787923 /DNA_START=100 /DNA_END=480 /DNA_ORIENTATION=-
MAAGDAVKTIYGEGRVVKERKDGVVVVVLESWRLANATRPTLYLSAESVTKLDRPFVLGQHVKTIYGDAVITQVREDDYELKTVGWKLANDTATTMYLREEMISSFSPAQESYLKAKKKKGSCMVA